MTTIASRLILLVQEVDVDRKEKNLKSKNLVGGKKLWMLANLVKRIRYPNTVAIIKRMELKIIRMLNLMEQESHSPLMKIQVYKVASKSPEPCSKEPELLKKA